MDDLLVDRLHDGSAVSLTAFPDGSVDTFYHVSEDSGGPLSERRAFAERLAAGTTKSYEITAVDRDPGGQSVNVARQWHALGDDVALYGHLDDEVFAGLPFETYSMGEPTRVSIFEFRDGDFFFAEESDHIHDWDLDDLRRVAENGLSEHLERPAICCVNWISCAKMTAQIKALADLAHDGGYFVFDPGDVTGADSDSLLELLDALGELQATYDVVMSLNENEAAAVADAVGETDRRQLASIRERAMITGVVVHGTHAAAAATSDGPIRVPQQVTDDPRRQTGGGDRFTAGLAHALGLGWDWEMALALGNGCASYYVSTGETGSQAEIATFLAES